MNKKKKGANPNRHRTLKRETRLEIATTWIKNYKGNHLVKAYSKHFALDKLSAVNDLKLLGIHVSEKYIKELKALARAQEKKKLKLKEDKLFNSDSDETFFFIAGYTSGGAPYGVTWEEMEGNEKIEEIPGVFDEDDIPF